MSSIEPQSSSPDISCVTLGDTSQGKGGYYAIMWGWLLPAHCAQRSRRISLGRAWCLHVFAMLASVATLFVCGGIIHDVNPLELAQERVGSIILDPAGALPDVGIAVGIEELFFVVLALLVATWGCQDEPISTSLKNAFRQTWLHATHLLVIVTIVGIMDIGFRRQIEAYDRSGGTYGDGSEPFLLKYQMVIGLVVFSALVAWFLWSLVRAVATPRPSRPMEREPLCELCGYNLRMAPKEGRCPECGEHVIKSLGPDVRLGCAWDHRRELGIVKAYFRTTATSLLKPR